MLGRKITVGIRWCGGPAWGMGRAEEEGGKETQRKHRNSPPAMWLSAGYCRRREQKSRRVLERGGKVKVVKGAAGEQGGKTSKQWRQISINL